MIICMIKHIQTSLVHQSLPQVHVFQIYPLIDVNNKMCSRLVVLAQQAALIYLLSRPFTIEAQNDSTKYVGEQWRPLVSMVDALLPADYRPSRRPINGWGGPLNVSISFQLNRILFTSEIEQSYELDAIFIQRWRDERLNISHLYHHLVIDDATQIKRFWLPDTYFVNGRAVSIMSAPVSAQQLIVDDNQMLTYVTRIDATFYCYMNLLNYPQDYQYCRVDISSRKFCYKQS